MLIILRRSIQKDKKKKEGRRKEDKSIHKP